MALAAERRLIPFLGAGFSSSLGLPSWEDMLRDVCRGVESALPFDELLAATNNDLLQVAEYLYLKHDRQIGPIRHQIEKSFSASPTKPVLSGAHVELVNLGAGQIYTTNYDDIIELTYRSLGLPVNSVILPKDVALADTDRTQVVKYHGDLAHERTLVLTESAYYKRLDFESPMDLKFRSDLLGKSVLFMGYSFRDINIRIIWFKLMDMMRDIPEADRRPSYIVRLDPNPALEELYAAVGLKTIVLNPDGGQLTSAERASLVGQFLFQLSSRASTRALKGGGDPRAVFVSQTALDHGARLVEQFGSYGPHSRRFGSVMDAHDPIVSRLFTGTVPAPLESAWENCVTDLLPFAEMDSIAISLIERLRPSDKLTQFVVEILQSSGNEESRPAKVELLGHAEIWEKIWAFDIEREQAEDILRLFRQEILYQAGKGADEDIAYLAELAKRVELGLLAQDERQPKQGKELKALRQRATELLAAASQIYPSIATLAPTRAAPPQVQAVLAEVQAREENFEPMEVDLVDQVRLAVPRPGVRPRTTLRVPPPRRR